jgi:hypothetical protein
MYFKAPSRGNYLKYQDTTHTVPDEYDWPGLLLAMELTRSTHEQDSGLRTSAGLLEFLKMWIKCLLQSKNWSSTVYPTRLVL